MSLKDRLNRVEARLARDDAPLTGADVYEAHTRQGARALMKICRRLGVDSHDARVAEGMSGLDGDDEARIIQDAMTVAQWRAQHGVTMDAAGARQRIAARLDAMARRLQDAESALPSYQE